MFRDLLRNIVVVACFSIYTVGTLWLADTLLAEYLPGYVFSGNYKIGIIIFFVSTLTYIYWARWRGWNNWRYYIFGGIAVFFPLVFIASAFNSLSSVPSSMITSFVQIYCGESSIDIVRGKAFGAVVTSMSLRALPAVMSVPALIYFFVIKPASERV